MLTTLDKELIKLNKNLETIDLIKDVKTNTTQMSTIWKGIRLNYKVKY